MFLKVSIDNFMFFFKVIAGGVIQFKYFTRGKDSFLFNFLNNNCKIYTNFMKWRANF